MTDWHCHILPGMDDGSRDVEESLALLAMQSSQGVDVVIATPHFYANDEDVTTFLERRRHAFDVLSEHLSKDSPEIRLGAEVRYYRGIAHMDGLSLLKAENTDLLLLEMPCCKWSEYMLRELDELASRGRLRLILAHIERYMNLQSRDVWDRLYRAGIEMQVNADFFASRMTSRKAISLLKKGKISFIGSDCHNPTSRPPRLDKAYEVIEKKLGREFICQMDEYGKALLGT